MIFDQNLVARSMAGDDHRIAAYLRSNQAAIPTYVELNQDAYGQTRRYE